MDGEEAFRKLKQLYPELEDGVVQEALVNNDYDLKRASDYLGVRRGCCRVARETGCKDHDNLTFLSHNNAGQIL